MTLLETQNKYLEKSRLAKYFAEYELYYQISLGNYVYKTVLDLDETIKIIQELNLQVNSFNMLSALNDAMIHFAGDDDFEDKLDYNTRMRACLQSLDDFVEADKQAYLKIFKDAMQEEIVNDTFFTQHMKNQFSHDYEQALLKWESSINNISQSDIHKGFNL